MEGQLVPKERNEFTGDDLTAFKKNARAKNILFYGLGPDEYNRISNFSTIKKI